MSNHRIDNIFKNKLEGQQVNPPAEAWPAIHSQLKGRRINRIPIHKIAASLLLIGLAAYSGYMITSSDNIIQGSGIEQTITSETKPAPEIEAGSTSNLPALIEDESKSKLPETENFNKLHHFNLELLQPVAGIGNQLTTINQIEIIKQVSYEKTLRKPLVKVEEERLPAITISYKSGNKMLMDDATSEPEKESTLRRAWDYALSVKNGEERPLNIKEMKNELFASDFKKKKSKSQD
jgi:hypothetical protein